MDEVSTIKAFFQSRQVHLSTGWLEGCISWCKEENLPPNYTPKDLQLKVYEQWLLLDLRDVEVPCLPPGLSNKTKYVLTDNYSLQMMKVVDISKPKYWQLQRIRNNTSGVNETETESSKRVLQMTLTDGVQEVEAMEYKHIPCLNLNLTPGIKIRLMGPITVRKGRLMLEAKNVKILGGEVEDLIVPNAAENVLAACMRLPLNPKPAVIEERLLTENMDVLQGAGNKSMTSLGANKPAVANQCSAGSITSTTIASNNPGLSNSRIDRNNSVNLPVVGSNRGLSNNSIMNNTINCRNNSNRNVPHAVPGTSGDTSKITKNAVNINDDEDMIAEEIQLLLEAERDFEEQAAKRRKSDNKTPDLFEDMEDDAIFENIDIPPAHIETALKLKTSPVLNNKIFKDIAVPSTSAKTCSEPLRNENVIRNGYNSVEVEENFFEKMDTGVNFNQVTKESSWKPVTAPKPLVLTIEKLLKNLPNITNGKFKIRAKFCGVEEKLTVVNDDYYFVINVKDDTGSLAVRVHSDLLSDIAGYCAPALTSFKAAVERKDEDAQRTVVNAIRKIKDRLVSLNDVVEVQISAKEKFPVIVRILE
ncbi:hypothetical protein NQ315_003054 [Exocentrus adspersus]|uniref:RecQ-mediated genome instability protein 1 n=1 Tax=Exocentrus adspersus TaxID=1586481 RepID=A0AAV8W453_9CUCU|nr:hypothetical protein NQ315_003054 [Exocentrus adspersus]